ncbi:LacI family transcriptional regulator [bacterium]|nr:LacI family transcriptional regulator [bacterium]
MPATLRDVAQRARLSVSTVSNILSSNDSRYSDSSRAAVLKAAKELDYHPSRAARAMQSKRSNVLGVIVPDITYSYFTEIIRGVEREADRAGLQLLLCQTHYDPAQETRKIALLREHRVDGIVLFPKPFSQDRDLYLRLRKSRLPVVCVDAEVEGVPFDFVGTDDCKGAFAAVTHLIRRGHRRIACIAFGDESAIKRTRLEGYRNALASAGIPYAGDLVAPGPWELDAPGDALLSLFTRDNRPTAIFAMSDLFGVWGYFKLKEAGLAVPRDVSIVGFGGMHEGRWLDVPLTTMMQNGDLMGRHAVAMLVERIARPQLPQRRMLFEPELIIRASVAEPAAAHAPEN